MANRKTTGKPAREAAFIFDPRNDNYGKGRKASRAAANANTATLALLDAIRDGLGDCATATWADAADAQRTANELLMTYAAMSGRDSGETFELPNDDGRELPVRFTLEGF